MAQQLTTKIKQNIFRTARFLLNRQSKIHQLSDEAFIHYCYTTLLNRQPDEEAIGVWQSVLAQGHSRLEVIGAILASDEYEKKRLGGVEFVSPGHFYSVIPSPEEIEQTKENHEWPDAIPGVVLNNEAQWQLLQRFSKLYAEQPYSEVDQPHLRYRHNNGSFAPSDAILLHLMIRKMKPKQIIEVGSGFSSGVILDTNELFFDNQLELTFIEPYPDLLYSVMKPADKTAVTVIADKVQGVDTAVFKALEANDILFIDSSHVSKIGSDVNHFIFNIFPLLQSGVIIHIHDIFYPFSYPYRWLKEGRFWNEHFLLRAFLQYNDAFEILLFSSQMIHNHHDWVAKQMPELLKTGGCIWLRKR